VVLTHLHEGSVARLTAQLDWVLLVRPQLIVTGHPYNLCVSLPQLLQHLLNIGEGIADVACHDQPASLD
jgi:hypothetical protein